MGEAVRHHVALRLRCSVSSPIAAAVRMRGLDVARLDEGRLALALQVSFSCARPDAGEAIGLQLDPHLDAGWPRPCRRRRCCACCAFGRMPSRFCT